MSANDSTTLEARIKALQEKEKEALRICEERNNCKNKFVRLQKGNAFTRAAGLFSFPFKGDVFADIWITGISLICTFIFSVVGGFVLFGAVLCALADLLYIPLFGVFYPFAVLFDALFGPLRVRGLKKKLARLEGALAKKEPSALRVQIAMLERELAEARSREALERAANAPRYMPMSGVTNTDYYKAKCDEEYRRLMGLPPKDDSLPSYATDPALDLHPGDY